MGIDQAGCSIALFKAASIQLVSLLIRCCPGDVLYIGYKSPLKHRVSAGFCISPNLFGLYSGAAAGIYIWLVLLLSAMTA
jgi:hypothetical protein